MLPLPLLLLACGGEVLPAAATRQQQQQRRTVRVGVSASAKEKGEAPTALQNHTHDPYFPIFHVRPDDGWHTNDPNAPFWFNGVFHLFSQCRQMAAVLPIPPGGWCHYASVDLIKWRRLGYALRPDRWYDNISLDTGSATIVDGVPTMLIPSVGKVTDGSVNFSCPQFRAPSLRGPCRVRMTQAVPRNLSDPWLRVWDKPDPDNPLIDAPPSDIEVITCKEESCSPKGHGMGVTHRPRQRGSESTKHEPTPKLHIKLLIYATLPLRPIPSFGRRRKYGSETKFSSETRMSRPAWCNFSLQKTQNGPIWGWLGIRLGIGWEFVGSRCERFSDQKRPKCGQGT